MSPPGCQKGGRRKVVECHPHSNDRRDHVEDMTSDLVYREKKRGTRTEPWGTPVVRVRGADTDPLQVSLPGRLQPKSVQSLTHSETETVEMGSDGSQCRR